MTTPSTATPAAIAFRDKALSTFKSAMEVKDPKDNSDSLTLLALSAGYCVKLIATNDPLLLTHHTMHNVLFLVRNEYNALTSATPKMATPPGYQAVTSFCRDIQVARAAVATVPAPITPQDKALADIAEVMAEAKAKRPRKIVKSKAVVEDKDDDEVEFVTGITDTDFTMGGCDAASGADTMAVDNIFGDEEANDTPAPPKDKSKKRASPGSKTTAKGKRAETAAGIDNAKAGNSSGKRARTEPPFIGGLAELQSLQSEAGNPLVIDNPVYREILARAHAAVTRIMPGKTTLGYYRQQEVDLRERVLLSMHRLELELRLRDLLVTDYEFVLAQIKECDPKGKSVAVN